MLGLRLREGLIENGSDLLLQIVGAFQVRLMAKQPPQQLTILGSQILR